MKEILEFTDDEWQEIIRGIEGSSAAALWDEANDNDRVRNASYEDRKQFFLSAMCRLMKEGRVKIASSGVFWDGTIEEQIQRYSDRWPRDESQLDKADFQLIEVDGLLCYWAQGGFVWVYEDGFMEWT
ncbi:DUF596 domain-containing protein [Advenella mimigardefordensis]|uniref:DUF596 domain-containing protein n=1 Tax=Advenella mimigardefordensis TaxID=302406 RepID=UPI00046D1A8E|nr:DUF596 domain-containing protein [Advenella mimigardefordensis]